MPSTNKPKKILVVDDSCSKREKLLEDAVACGFEGFTAVDGQDGWDILQEHKEEIDLIILDRVMPRMDGMEFMKKLKSKLEVADIPVIMVTVEGAKEQVVEGIEAGVYYYLPIPYDKTLLKSIMTAAIREYTQLKEVRASVGGMSRVVNLLNDCNFSFQTLDDARRLTPILASFFPDPSRVALGITELLVNAVEHGNLGITYEEKTQLVNDNAWEKEINRRLAQQEFASRRVAVRIMATATDISLWIRDEGNGFDWSDYLQFSPERATDNHGRGIAMSNMVSFDTIQYLGKGNEVICKAFRQVEKRSA